MSQDQSAVAAVLSWATQVDFARLLALSGLLLVVLGALGARGSIRGVDIAAGHLAVRIGFILLVPGGALLALPALQTFVAAVATATPTQPPTSTPQPTPRPSDTPVPTMPPTSTPVPTATEVPAVRYWCKPTEVTDGFDVRSGPGITSTTFRGRLNPGDEVTVLRYTDPIGRPLMRWFQVKTPDGRLAGWMMSREWDRDTSLDDPSWVDMECNFSPAGGSDPARPSFPFPKYDPSRDPLIP